ncbi:glycosyltransferase family 4 protein [Carboxylicivirga taeanensis]|uniref:glycosyltransferase family 4 protein n=1 Tax=Carboxylicivirga taeanensis TaxID=1416875 RepID=UPI003F6E240E
MKNYIPHIGVLGLKGIPAIGGTATVGENLVKELNDRYRFTVYATASHASAKQPYPNVYQFIFKKLFPHRLNIFYYNLMAALHALLFANYDLVHTHQIDTAYVVPLLRLKYRVVSTHHGRTYNMDKWGRIMRAFFRKTEGLMMKYANQVTFVSDLEREHAEKTYGGNYLTIKNGVDPYHAIGEKPNLEDYVMFAAGRIIPLKGCLVFLEALKKINYEGKVVVAGDYNQIPEHGQQLLAYANDLDIDFVGMIKDKAVLMAYVKNASLFVFPSYSEAMSLMLLEVISMKTPLICSDIPANKAILSHREVEFFKVGDSNDLATKIMHFLANPVQFEAKADEAYKKLIQSHQWKDIADEYSDIYQNILV